MTASPPPPGSESTFIDPSLPPGQRVAFPSVYGAAETELTVVVPAYNEEKRLPQMLDEAVGYLNSRASAHSAFTYEVIVVDDGSSDGTAKAALSFVSSQTAERVRLLQLSRNRGKGAAVRAGVLAARGRFVLMADADAATRFADIEKLERAVAVGASVAIGSRTHLKGTGKSRGLLRGLASVVFNMVVVYVGGVLGIGDTQCGFKLYSRAAACVAFGGQKLDRWAFDVENLFRCQQAGLLVVEVPVAWTEVPGSKLSVVKATINMFKDMLRMRYNYVFGRWALTAPQ